MADNEQTPEGVTEGVTEGIDVERVERHLRSVRLKLVSARRELQTLMRQSGLARGKRGMDHEIGRAERHVQELEQTETELVKQLEESSLRSGDDSAEVKEAAAATGEAGDNSDEGATP